MTLRTAPTLIALLACLASSAQTGKVSRCVTSNSSETASWAVYDDSTHHFCLRYPRSYRENAKPKGACAELRDEHTKASIYICKMAEAFELSALVARAPTGIESPPEPVQVGNKTFYYYGPGGGGVPYPDQYFFDLNGKTLNISFDGPYENDKTPSNAAKKMEMISLESFREY